MFVKQLRLNPTSISLKSLITFTLKDEFTNLPIPNILMKKMREIEKALEEGKVAKNSGKYTTSKTKYKKHTIFNK